MFYESNCDRPDSNFEVLDGHRTAHGGASTDVFLIWPSGARWIDAKAKIMKLAWCLSDCLI